MKFIQPKSESLEPRHIQNDCSLGYFHPNPIIKKVFLSRLHCALSLIESRQYVDILDIGVGCGYMIPSLTQYGKVFGVDIKQFYLDRASQICNENMIKADLRLASVMDTFREQPV